MLFRLLKEMLCKWSRHQQLPQFHMTKCFQKLVFILSHTFAIKTVKRKISGEICKSHLLESRRTDFAAANLMWGLSLSLPKKVQVTHFKSQVLHQEKKINQGTKTDRYVIYIQSPYFVYLYNHDPISLFCFQKAATMCWLRCIDNKDNYNVFISVNYDFSE
jgi:hypothetical protein